MTDLLPKPEPCVMYKDLKKMSNAEMIDRNVYTEDHPEYDADNPDNNMIPGPHNIDRAAWALLAVDVFAAQTFDRPHEEDVRTVLGDFLCDFMHLCRLNGVDFDEIHSQAQFHYDEEKEGRW